MDRDIEELLKRCRTDEDCRELCRLLLRKGMGPKSSVPSVFKIRNHIGSFSTGGGSPSFTEKGKSWASITALKSHLRNLVRLTERWEQPEDPNDILKYDDCEVVEYRLVEIRTFPCDKSLLKKKTSEILGE